MLFDLLSRASSYACKLHKAERGILWIDATFNILHTCIQVFCAFSFLALLQGGAGGEAGGCCSPIPCAAFSTHHSFFSSLLIVRTQR